MVVSFPAKMDLILGVFVGLLTVAVGGGVSNSFASSWHPFLTTELPQQP